jgi:hypothetical protein
VTSPITQAPGARKTPPPRRGTTPRYEYKGIGVAARILRVGEILARKHRSVAAALRLENATARRHRTAQPYAGAWEAPAAEPHSDAIARPVRSDPRCGVVRVLAASLSFSPAFVARGCKYLEMRGLRPRPTDVYSMYAEPCCRRSDGRPRS